jgi:cardiolipin synthase A/B
VGEFEKLFMQTWDKQKGKPLARREASAVIPPRGKDIVRAIGVSVRPSHS